MCAPCPYFSSTLKKILVKYRPQTQFCPDYSGKPLGFSSVFTAFGVLFFGAAIAIILFGLEHITNIFGLEVFIFNTYGIRAEFDENIIGKDERIIMLENEVSFLKKQASKVNTVVKSWDN